MSKMETRIPRADLVAALSVVRPAVGRGLFVPVLSHYCLAGDRVIGYDDEIAISVEAPVGVECAVPADLLNKLVGSMSAEDVVLVHTGAELRVSSGRSNVKIPALPKESFVYKGVDAGWRLLFELPITSEFLEGLQMCLVSVGSDPTHAAQMGITWEGDTFYSTDNVTMSRFVIKDLLEVPSTPIILPTAFCRELLALVGKADLKKHSPLLRLYDHAVVVHVGTWADLFSKIDTNEAPLDFAEVFSKHLGGPAGKPCSIPTQWEAAFSRAAAVVDQKRPVACVDVDDDVLSILTSSTVGEVRDALGVRGARNAEQFYVDPQHVLRVSKQVKTFDCRPSALVLYSGNYTHLIAHCSK